MGNPFTILMGFQRTNLCISAYHYLCISIYHWLCISVYPFHPRIDEMFKEIMESLGIWE